ncbi:MAG: DUF1573 domain-containing protein [Candidatus Aminicenantes bacterium]|nr:DUF1573 domain-containing protein [Candidatus Aminicenantes bacterium]
MVSGCRKYAVSAGMFLLVLWGPALSPAEAAKKPRIVLDAVRHDFGSVKQNVTLKHEFAFKNAGEAVLNIGRIETTCGCTAALASRKQLKPGQDGQVMVTFSTEGLAGKVIKWIYIHSNDPARPRAEFRVEADVITPPQPRIDIAPFTVDLGLLMKGEPLRAEVVVSNRGERELVVESDHKTAVFTAGGRPMSWPAKIPPGKEMKVGIRVLLPDRIGIFREFVQFQSNDPARPVLSFSLAGYITTPAQVREFLSKHK